MPWIKVTSPFSTVTRTARRRWRTSSSSSATTNGARTVKVLAWDLDNTVWSGVLVEDGPDGVCLKDGVADVIKDCHWLNGTQIAGHG